MCIHLSMCSTMCYLSIHVLDHVLSIYPCAQVGEKWRAQVGNMESGHQRKYYSAYVRSPEQAARDADM